MSIVNFEQVNAGWEYYEDPSEKWSIVSCSQLFHFNTKEPRFQIEAYVGPCQISIVEYFC